MNNIKDFYPTPKKLAEKMFDKIQNLNDVEYILEPSAGRGDLLEHTFLKNVNSIFNINKTIHAIEINKDLQNILIGKNIPVIDDDFLQYKGDVHYDLIIANFPFSEGVHHLNKAIDIMFRGQIVCVLNAETIKNPFSNERKKLASRLKKLNANIEFLKDEFDSAERKTSVEIALIHINIEKNVETDLFENLDDEKDNFFQKIETNDKEIIIKKEIENLVERFNVTKNHVEKSLFDFYKHYKYVRKYLRLSVNDRHCHDRRYMDDEINVIKGVHLTKIMREKHNQIIKKLKKEFWGDVFGLRSFYKYMTSNQRGIIKENYRLICQKEFNEKNILTFLKNLVAQMPDAVEKSIIEVFDTICGFALKDDYWRDEEYKNNIHYFNAWKTNSGYKINKKFIIPFDSSCIFSEDLESICSYFKPTKNKHFTIKEHLDDFKRWGEQKRNLDTEYFKISIFKKGTVHFVFKDLDLLRMFNVYACKNKNFIPKHYANKNYDDLTSEEKQVVNNFEEKNDYKLIKTLNGGANELLR